MEDLESNGYVRRARLLSDATGMWFNSTVPPGYFGGDLDAEVVLVHLNPKQTDERDAKPDLGTEIASFERLVERAIHFGDEAYGPASPRTHRSPFDHKQVRFLKALDALPFVEERSPIDRFTNLALAIDGKLQMEIIPYGSPGFESWRFTESIIRPHFERLMTVIGVHPRRYVLFCGKVFETILRDYVVQQHEFRLTKKDGTQERAKSRFAVLEIPFEGTLIRAGLATSYARQGIGMRAYGEMVRRLYPR